MYAVLAVPGRRTTRLEAETMEAAEAEVVSMLPAKAVNLEWKDSGSGRLLTARGSRGGLLGHYWVRPVKAATR